MIRPLRRAHRLAWVALTGIVLGVLILAIAGREPEPPSEALLSAAGSVAP